jgi:transcriptional regulator with XRE-family HTH domain
MPKKLKSKHMNNVTEITRHQLETIYRIILKRIAKGYTGEQLSIIMGREPAYITALELLQIPLNTSYELRKIAAALGDPDLSSFFTKTQDNTLHKVLMEKEFYGNTYIHTCDIILDDDKEVPFFFLQEELSASLYISMN